MVYNLLREPWIPVVCQSGQRRWIRPDQIADPVDPPLSIQTGSPVLDSAALQYLIGLNQTCHTPKAIEEWRRLRAQPPTEAELAQWYLPVVPAMDLDGPGPRFLQDSALEAEVAEAKAENAEAKAEKVLAKAEKAKAKAEKALAGAKTAKARVKAEKALAKAEEALAAPDEDDEGDIDGVQPIERLLPGGASKRNTVQGLDLFCKSGITKALGPAAVAMCLMSKQWLQPGAGGGFFNPVRGNQVVTVTVTGATLWETVWRNVVPEHIWRGMPGQHLEGFDLPRIFPWLAPRSEDPKTPVSPKDWDTRMIHWTMPQRLWCLWEPDGACDLSGHQGLVSREFHQAKHGAQYGAADCPWQHPLVYYLQVKDKIKIKTICLQGSADLARLEHWFLQISGDHRPPRPLLIPPPEDAPIRFVHVSCNLADKADITGWLDVDMPVLVTEDQDLKVGWQQTIQDLLTHAQAMAGILLKQTQTAVTVGKSVTRPGLVQHATEAYWHQIRQVFSRVATQTVLDVATQAANGPGQQGLRRDWAICCHNAVLGAYTQETQGLAGTRYHRKVVECRIVLRDSTNPHKAHKGLQLTKSKGAAK